MKAQWAGIAIVIAGLTMAGQAGAAPDEATFKALAKKKGCFNCHGMDKPILGPSLRDMGRKYAGDAGAPKRLAGIIKNGSKGGVWGSAAMPAYARLGDDDIRLLVQFILSLK